MMLFDARAHEPLTEASWNPAEVEAEIRTIARDAEEALRGRDWWPLHPLDAGDGIPEVIHGIYFGAAGAVWGLHSLEQAGLHEPRHDYPRLAEDVLDSYLSSPDFGARLPSTWVGEGGIVLVAWLLAPTPELADRLAEIVVVDPRTDTPDLIYGSPGLLLIADAMLRQTGEARWASAWSAIADHLIPDLWSHELLGAAHGFPGIVAALARRPDLLPTGDLAPKATATLAATAVREGDCANWPSTRDAPLEDDGGLIRTQWCHGAPGVVASFATLPPEEELDSLLLSGGELTWQAGPLRKGAGLCHGTAGNGFALLKLFTRTGDEAWLERARRFAMHAASQVGAARRHYGRGRYTLWTGDLGTAMFLHQCLRGTSEMPTVEAW